MKSTFDLTLISDQVTEMLGLTLTDAATETLFSEEHRILGMAQQWGVGDTEVRGDIADVVTRAAIGDDVPTYGDNLTTEETKDFFARVKDALDEKGWLK